MKTISLTFSLLTIVLLSGCASVKIDTEYDDSRSFDTYQTFGWMEAPASIQDNLSNRGRVMTQIKNSIEQELIDLGFSQNGSPDFLVVYHAAMDRKISGATIDTWGYRYGRRWYRNGVAVGQVQVETYNEGTLLIDIVDAESKELVWRGVASGVVNNPNHLAEKIGDVVKQTLAQFPPKTNA